MPSSEVRQGRAGTRVTDFDFFDSNLTLGHPAIPKLRTQVDPAAMRSDLAAVGVTGGLVRHTLSLEWHATEGNAELSKVLEDQSGFEAVWAAMPHWTGEFPSPAELRSGMARNHVRAVIMYPTRQGYPMRATVTGPLLEMLEAARAPLFLPLAEADLGVVETIARSHPALPVIVTEASYRMMREVYALWSAVENVLVETSGFMVHRGIEDVVRRFGPHRLVFGTRYPLFVPGCAVAGLVYARIPDSAKEAIAGDNMRKLLSKADLT